MMLGLFLQVLVQLLDLSCMSGIFFTAQEKKKNQNTEVRSKLVHWLKAHMKHILCI